MTENHSLEEIRKKAHEIKYYQIEKGHSVKKIEILGYYSIKIAASNLCYYNYK